MHCSIWNKHQNAIIIRIYIYMYIHKNKTNQMPHITYFTTTELLFYYLQIESISAIIIIKIVKKTSFNYTSIPNCNRRRCSPRFPLEHFRDFRFLSLVSFIMITLSDSLCLFLFFSVYVYVYVIYPSHTLFLLFLHNLCLTHTHTILCLSFRFYRSTCSTAFYWNNAIRFE